MSTERDRIDKYLYDRHIYVYIDIYVHICISLYIDIYRIYISVYMCTYLICLYLSRDRDLYIDDVVSRCIYENVYIDTYRYIER